MMYGPLAAAAGMLQASGPSRMPVGLGQVAGAGLSGMLNGAPIDAANQQRQQMGASLGQIADKFNDPSVVKAAWQGTAGPMMAMSGISPKYFSNLAQRESGNRNIRQGINQNGTAFGPFQFTAGTWNSFVAQNPSLGLTPNDRMNPKAQGMAIVPFTMQNQRQLTASLGREPTEAELMLAHRFGADGATALLQNPTKTVGQVLPAAAAANPQWGNLRVNAVLQDSGITADGDPADAADDLGGMSDMGGAQAPQQATQIGMTGPYTAQPFSLHNLSPEMKDILQIALRDPTLGPSALQALITTGMSGGGMINPAQAARLNEEAARTGLMGQRIAQSAAQAQQNERMQNDRLDVARGNQAIAQQRLGVSQQEQQLGQQRLAYEQQKPLLDEANKQWTAAVGAATPARAAMDQLDQLDHLNTMIHTGKFAGTTKDLLNWAQSAGIDPAVLGVGTNAAPYEVYQAIASNMAMHLRNPPGQGNLMPGQMSNYEDQLLQSMGPQLAKTPQGNALLIQVQKRIQQRAIDFAQFATDWQKSHGNVITPQWFDDSNKWWTDDKHRLLTPDMQKQFDTLSKPQAQTRAPSAADLSAMDAATLHALPDDVKAAINADPALLSILKQKFAK